MTDLPLTSGVSLLIVLLMFGATYNVGKARHRYGISAPATSGHEMFDRAYRIQMNTLEWALMTLPCVWIFAAYVSDGGAALLAGVWLAARVRYAFAYQREPKSRGRAFVVAGLAFGALGLGAGGGVLWRLIGAWGAG